MITLITGGTTVVWGTLAFKLKGYKFEANSIYSLVGVQLWDFGCMKFKEHKKSSSTIYPPPISNNSGHIKETLNKVNNRITLCINKDRQNKI